MSSVALSVARMVLLLCMAVALSSASMRCPVVTHEGDTYDLSSITDTSPLLGKIPDSQWKDYTISFTACGKSKLVSKCTSDGVAMCVIGPSGSWTYSPAKFESQDDIMMIVEAPGLLQLTFENMEDGGKQKLRGVVNINCGKDDGKGTASIDRTQRPIVFTITATHPAGCKGGAPSGAGGGGGGLSGGWIFVIAFLSAVFVYVVVGCLINWRVRGLPLGAQACPQGGFWCALPGLTKDGCVFTARKLKACCSGGGKGGASANTYGNIDTV